MMLLTDLPDEIIIMIIQGFDLFTLQSLYNTCQRIRNIVCMFGVIKRGYMSKNVMATVNTLKLRFFKDISHHLLELDMRGVPDLCKTAFIPALKRLKNLKVLDISYTNLNILDLMKIQKICPTIKDIAINFTFGKTVDVPNEIVLQSQSLFQHFENIHFIGSIENLLYSNITLRLLAKANLRYLKYSVSNCCSVYTSYQELEKEHFPPFEQFTVYVLNWNHRRTLLNLNYIPLCHIKIFSSLDIYAREYIIILIKEFEPIVYASSIFTNFFKENFNVTVENIPDYDLRLDENVTVMAWNKDTTKVDEQFYNILLKKIKQYFPYYFSLSSEVPAPKQYNWFYTVPTTPVCEQYKNVNCGMNKKRRAGPNLVLKCDVIFRDKQQVELSFDFRSRINVIALSTDCLYLRKLTFLSLVGFGRYTSDFFNILFSCSDNLVTLNVEPLPVSPCASAIARSVPLSRSLKNLRLIDKPIDFNILFSALGQCPNLENIIVMDETSLTNNVLADPDVVLEKCDKLYNFYIIAQMSESTRTKAMQLFNKAKIKNNRPYTYVGLQQISECNPYSYDPFVDVFRLNPIRPV